LGDELKEAIIEEHPEKSGLERDYHQDFSLDSTGYNFGVEIRLYPAGREGSFSLGLSLEKTEMRLDLEGSATDEFSDGSYFEGLGTGELLIDLISYHLSFRWDIKPSARFHPYFGLGFGELMRQESFKITPMAILSRATAGTRGKSLIINLPGSLKAVKECLEIILSLIPHALDMIKGKGHEKCAVLQRS
ncbi:unnamed protein product, partial [marine sediment metagenome]